MSQEITITVSGRGIPEDHYANVIDGSEKTPRLTTELTGPETAFILTTRNGKDYAKVLRRSLVTAKYFETV